MSARFFVDERITSNHVRIAGPEAHHLIHVIRANVADEITLFDGSGAEFSARIVRVGRSDAQLDIVERVEIDRELGFELTIGVALPKGERQKWLVEKCVELGVTRIVPLQTDRAVALASTSALQRLRRTVVEASKQCGRNLLLEIAPPQHVAGFLTECPSGACRVIADPGGAATALRDAKGGDTYIAIGPEGGFTSGELSQAAEANWDTISLGPRILRIETAAVAVAAYFALRN